MGLTSGGPRGIGVMTSPFTPKADFTSVLAKLAARGGHLGGITQTERDAISGTSLFAGLTIFNTTSGNTEFYDGAAWKRNVSFRKFALARGGMTDGTLFFQVPTEDTSKAALPGFSFSYDGANGRVTPEAGIYELHVAAHPGGATTGTTFVQIAGSVQGVLMRQVPALSADPWMTGSAVFRADGTEGFVVSIQKQTGGASAGFGTLNMVRVGNL